MFAGCCARFSGWLNFSGENNHLIVFYQIVIRWLFSVGKHSAIKHEKCSLHQVSHRPKKKQKLPVVLTSFVLKQLFLWYYQLDIMRQQINWCLIVGMKIPQNCNISIPQSYTEELNKVKSTLVITVIGFQTPEFLKLLVWCSCHPKKAQFPRRKEKLSLGFGFPHEMIYRPNINFNQFVFPLCYNSISVSTTGQIPSVELPYKSNPLVEAIAEKRP